MSRINELLIPNVTSLPSQDKAQTSNKLTPGQKSEFDQLVKQAEKPQAKNGVEISTHATKRLQERNIEFDTQEYMKLQEALGKLRVKGGHDSLVITNKAAYVMDVDRGMVVTAVDRDSMGENVFTKIDSTIFMN
jgi:flagellar operon protein